MKHKDNDDQIVLRVPRKLRQTIEQEALAAERTLAAQTRHILKTWAAERDQSEAA